MKEPEKFKPGAGGLQGTKGWRGRGVGGSYCPVTSASHHCPHFSVLACSGGAPFINFLYRPTKVSLSLLQCAQFFIQAHFCENTGEIRALFGKNTAVIRAKLRFCDVVVFL